MKYYKICIAIFTALSVIISTGCSTSKIAKRGIYVNEDTIKAGMSRDEVLSLLGAPIESQKLEGNKKKDFFRLEQGESTGGKVAKGFGTTLIAVGTLGLSELVANPVATSRGNVSISVWYNQNDIVEKSQIINAEKNIKKERFEDNE